MIMANLDSQDSDPLSESYEHGTGSGMPIMMTKVKLIPNSEFTLCISRGADRSCATSESDNSKVSIVAECHISRESLVITPRACARGKAIVSSSAQK